MHLRDKLLSCGFTLSIMASPPSAFDQDDFPLQGLTVCGRGCEFFERLIAANQPQCGRVHTHTNAWIAFFHAYQIGHRNMHPLRPGAQGFLAAGSGKTQVLARDFE